MTLRQRFGSAGQDISIARSHSTQGCQLQPLPKKYVLFHERAVIPSQLCFELRRGGLKEALCQFSLVTL